MFHAFSIVASRIGAAGYKLMRSSHEAWTSSQGPLKKIRTKNREGDATHDKIALTDTGSYKQTSSLECRLFVEDRTSIRSAGTSLLANSGNSRLWAEKRFVHVPVTLHFFTLEKSA